MLPVVGPAAPISHVAEHAGDNPTVHMYVHSLTLRDQLGKDHIDDMVKPCQEVTRINDDYGDDAGQYALGHATMGRF